MLPEGEEGLKRRMGNTSGGKVKEKKTSTHLLCGKGKNDVYVSNDFTSTRDALLNAPLLNVTNQ